MMMKIELKERKANAREANAREEKNVEQNKASGKHCTSRSARNEKIIHFIENLSKYKIKHVEMQGNL